MKVYIQQDTVDSEALWLIIERNDKPAGTKFIMGVKREEDSAGNVAFPFLKDEIESIKKACDKWLKNN